MTESFMAAYNFVKLMHDKIFKLWQRTVVMFTSGFFLLALKNTLGCFLACTLSTFASAFMKMLVSSAEH